jgi:hypothetical protein
MQGGGQDERALEPAVGAPGGYGAVECGGYTEVEEDRMEKKYFGAPLEDAYYSCF